MVPSRNVQELAGTAQEDRMTAVEVPTVVLSDGEQLSPFAWEMTGRLSQPITDEFIGPQTKMGATLVPGGATFRVWAPNALEVHVHVSDQPDMINTPAANWQPTTATRLIRSDDGIWSGFLPGVQDGDLYRFYVVGRGDPPYKRDPYARELEFNGYPDCDCVVRDPDSYPWHDQNFQPPAFNDLIIYQFHVGTFYAVDDAGNDLRPKRVARFLDLLDRIPYFVALGVNAIQPLPVVEFQGEHSLGYNGTDLYSPEMDYCVPPDQLAPYLVKVNAMLAERGCPPMTIQHLEGQVNQLKTLVDLCHLNGLAILLDVVYNHAGGPFDDQSIYFFDQPFGSNNIDSLYFTDVGHAGGLVFAFWKQEVRQFLIDNAKFFIEEHHVDGFRYDQVTVIDDNGAWRFLQDLTGTLQFIKPNVPHIAEYWRDDPSWIVRPREAGGAGFDAVWTDGLRDSIRGVLAQAAGGRDAIVNLDRLRDKLYAPNGFSAAWRAVQYIENHDLLDNDHTGNDKQPRIARLADSTDARSWYARSRSRVATGLLLTSPGIPMMFMGQEFLEDKYWTDNPVDHPGFLVWWDGLKTDRAMGDHVRFTQELTWLRRRHPALRGEPINAYYVHNDNRVLAFHRWIDGVGRDVVVVASLNESTFWNYDLGFPLPGRWIESFNSDVYDNWVNPLTAGNSGSIEANGPPRDGLPHSATITIPANGILVFTRDSGD
jgi:1,4-alpha-glucan branching enzyme